MPRLFLAVLFAAALAVTGSANRVTNKSSGAATITFSDDFTRANENPLSKSGAWTNGVTGYSNMWLQSNQAASSVAGIAITFVGTPSFTAYPNQSATVTSTGAVGIGCGVRITSGGNGYRIGVSSTTTVRFTRIDAGVPTVLGADVTVSTIVAGDTLTLGINGTTLTLYKNGIPQDTRTDATHATGSPAVFSNGTGATISYFTATSL